MPEEPLREQLGPIVVRRPALDGLRRVVDDPILGNAIPLIARPLRHPVVARGAGRKDLDGQAETTHNVRASPKLSGGYNQQIGLEHQARLELDVQWRRESLAETRRPARATGGIHALPA